MSEAVPYVTWEEGLRLDERRHMRRAQQALAEGNLHVAFDRLRKAANCVRRMKAWRSFTYTPEGPRAEEEREFIEAMTWRIAQQLLFG